MPEDHVQLLWRHRTTAIIRADSQAKAARAMDAAVRGGIRIVEFTMTTPGVLELIADFAGRTSLTPVDGLDRLVVGAGTVLSVDQAEAATKAGASFLVSPVFDREVVQAATRLGVASLPGTHTPTEMVEATRAGATMVKLFPAPAGGPTALRSIMAPLPFLRVVPTNGVTLENAAAWIEAGAFGVGLVRPLFLPADVNSGNEAAIEERARRFREVVMGVQRPAEPVPSGQWPG